MKHLSTIVMLMSLLCHPIDNLRANELVMVLSPNLHAEEAKLQAATVLEFLVTLDLGERVTVVDGYNLQSIGTFSVPNSSSYENPRAKMGANREFAAALMQFAQGSKLPANLSPGSMRLPQLLRHIGANYASQERVDVVMLGSPFYEGDNQFSMANGRIPSDGHINSSRSETPYGTTDQPDLLQNVRIHFGYGHEEVLQSDRHHFYVQRFWTLYIEALGGSLATFTADQPTLFRRSMSGAEPPSHTYVLNETQRLEMIILKTEVQDQSIYERELSSKELGTGQLSGAKSVEIAISWDCKTCDIDLWAQPYPYAQPIYFGNTETPEGTYHKDYETSPETINGFETIIFHKPVNLDQLLILVHFFDGHSPGGVKGEIRMTVDGLTFAKAFHIPGEIGRNDLELDDTLEGLLEYIKTNMLMFRGHQLFTEGTLTQDGSVL